VKIQGFRIELSEIESVARKFYDNQCAAVAVAIGEPGVQHLELAIEKADDGSGHQLLEYLKKYLPAYMIPEKIAFLKVFPQNANNKIDRRKIKELLQA
jgi:D-alanine--poly(phosphoribitol) ligase subunit 1